MCGIAGIYRYRADAPIDAGVLREMNRRQRHRGPDDEGLEISGRVGLGHTRLSIIDLSPLGHQPMGDEARGCTITYNGEIYNFKELRAWLESRGHRFRSRSDTEVVLRSYLELGPDCVGRLIGMFAFAIWDAPRQTLFLARDRTGEKPLVYSDHGGTFTFASEIRAMLADPEVPRDPDRVALGAFLGSGKAIPYPRTAYAAIKKLPPAHTLTVDRHGLRMRRYWAPDFSRKTTASFEESAERLQETLDATVSSMMVSDVPIGLLLSGGVDSSCVAVAMRRHTDQMRTFSCGGSETDEEFLRARMVATSLATDHSEHIFRLRPETMLQILDHFGEPISEPSIIYRLQMCEFIRSKGVTVVLCGDGGDEVLGGYDYYSLLRRHPLAKRLLARAAGGLAAVKALPHLRAWLEPRVEIHGLPVARAVGAALERKMRGNLAAVGCRDPEALGGVEEVRDLVVDWLEAARVGNVIDGAIFADLMVSLHHNHVMISDGVGMSQSLEFRSPYLDARMVEFAASLPWHYKVDTNPLLNKKILKRLFERRFPRQLVYARKIGYGGNIRFLQERHAGFWNGVYRRLMPGGRAAEMNLVDPGAFQTLAAFDPKEPEARVILRLSVVMLELWLDEVFGSGRFARSIADEFSSNAVADL